MIERNKYEAEFGPNHPTVKALDAELETMKNELKSLVERETSRIVELMSSTHQDSVDPTTRAREAVDAVVLAAETQVGLLKRQIAEVDTQIDEEKTKAAELAQVEQENEAQLREIERTRDLLEQLEEQMARVQLTEEDGGTTVVELTAPSPPYKVAPNLLRCIGLGGVLGLALGPDWHCCLKRMPIRSAIQMKSPRSWVSRCSLMSPTSRADRISPPRKETRIRSSSLTLTWR